MPFPYRLSQCALLIGTITLSTSVVAETSFCQHDAHVHGVVELNIAQDGKDLLMEITAPGSDVVGFEHTPSNEQQQQALENAVRQLKNTNSLFAFTSSANCQLTEAQITETLTAHNDHAHKHHDGHEHDEHDHEHDEHDHEHHDGHEHDEHDYEHHDSHEHNKLGHDHEHHAHGEFSAQYTFSCDNIEQLKELQVSWFKHFPNTEKITVQAITESSQKTEQLTASSTQFKF
ncbi:DUF2796 domain-containing protein [uncultured Photobacterium sp.]|uniref:zinc uptake protein ZrgA n=1 Tax=uncultured Photobacterium sp. TaxID=173973 RepID=UPI002604F252|nr:DUF2796 domain-containing protein [uncultured Photobacterium sp.]